MSVISNVDFDGIFNRYNEKFNYASDRLLQRIAADCDRYVPYRSGQLAGSVNFFSCGDGKASVCYTAPYARTVYYNNRGISFSKKKHPQSCAMWFEASRAVNAQSWIDEARMTVLR